MLAFGADAAGEVPLPLQAEPALAGVRGASPGIAQPMTAVVRWNGARSHYFVIAMPDFAGRQVETLLGSERRARRLMEQQLEAEVADLTQALGEAAVEIRVWKKSAEGRLGPSRTSR
mgnify:CR=1 FL=1